MSQNSPKHVPEGRPFRFMGIRLLSASLTLILMVGPLFFLVGCNTAQKDDGTARTSLSYEAYLEGRREGTKRTAESLDRARELFAKAVELDPSNPKAHSALSSTSCLLVLYGIEAPSDVFPKAEAAARQALAIDSNLSEAWASLGLVHYLYHWNWSEAESAFLKSIELDPFSGTSLHWYAMLFVARGDFENALGKIRRAQALEPSSRIIRAKHGQLLRLAGDLQGAEQNVRRAIETDPTFWLLHRELGEVLLDRGKLSEAVEALEVANQFSQNGLGIRSILGYAYGLTEKRGEAFAILGVLEERSKVDYVPATYLATVAAGLQDNDAALGWLERGLEQRDATMVYIKSKSAFRRLHSEKRFQAICDKMGL